MNKCTYTYICMYTHIHTRMYTYVCIHTYTYTHTYTYNCIYIREVAQSCPTLCDPMDYSLPGSSVHGIFQARVLEWVAISFSRDHPDPGNERGPPTL